MFCHKRMPKSRKTMLYRKIMPHNLLCFKNVFVIRKFRKNKKRRKTECVANRKCRKNKEQLNVFVKSKCRKLPNKTNKTYVLPLQMPKNQNMFCHKKEPKHIDTNICCHKNMPKTNVKTNIRIRHKKTTNNLTEENAETRENAHMDFVIRTRRNA